MPRSTPAPRPLALALALLAAAPVATPASTLAQAAPATTAAVRAPTIERVDPPNWWAGHSINPVRVLLRGRDLAGARLECAPLACGDATVSAAGTHAFVDVTVAHGAAPGTYPLRLRTAGGAVEIPFVVSAPLPAAGRFQGFGPDDVLYLLMPDRFANGDPSNDEPPASRGILDRAEPRRWHGGDLRGVRDRLPYLKELGITAIWMNPIYDNTNALDTKEVYDGKPTTAYHGYHAIDYYAVDERFGDLDELRALVDDAHAVGIKVILDMVANHTSAYHPWVADPPTPTWYHGTVADHPNNTWQTWTLADPYATPATRRETLDGWFIDILPDLNQDDAEVARYLVQNTLWWIGATGIDGIRQDTWPYVPRSFWKEWMTAIKREHPTVDVVGEVLDGDPTMIAFFEGGRVKHDGVDDGVDALFDFPLFYVLRSAFARGGPIRDVAQMLGRDRLYHDPASMVTLLGLHDVGRFMGEPGATTDGLKLAFTFLLTARGTPLVYYGDEIAMPGGNDPDNRRDFPGGWASDSRDAFTAAGRTAEQQDVWAHVQRLLRLRAERQDLRRGAPEHLHVGEQTFVYRRGATVVALNNGATPATITLPLPGLPPDALGACAAPRPEGGATTIVVPPRRGCIF